MAQMGRPGLSPEGKSEVWRRWRAGESFLGIGKALGKPVICLISSDRFNLGERPRLLQLNSIAA